MLRLSAHTATLLLRMVLFYRRLHTQQAGRQAGGSERPAHAGQRREKCYASHHAHSITRYSSTPHHCVDQPFAVPTALCPIADLPSVSSVPAMLLLVLGMDG